MGLIEESIQEYKNHPPLAYISESGKFVDFYDYIHEQFIEIVQPLILKNREQFVEYWPCFALFKLEKKKTGTEVFAGEVTGTHGTGFLVLTDKNVYMYLFRHFSKKHHPFKGMGHFILSAFFGNTTYQTFPIKQDMEIKDSISNVRILHIKSVYGVDLLPIELGARSFYLAPVKAGQDEKIFEYIREAKHFKNEM